MSQNQWFRLYNQTVNNPKVQRLSGDTFKGWINILCVTSQCDGRDVTRDNLSFHLRMSQEETDLLIDELVSADLLIDNGGIVPYNWDDRQYQSDSSAERTRLYRERKKKAGDEKCDVTVTPVVTPPDTDTDTDTEQIQKEKGKSSRFVPPSKNEVLDYMISKNFNHPEEAERFVNFYESNGWKVGRNKMKKWQSAVGGWIGRSNVTNKEPTMREKILDNSWADDITDNGFGGLTLEHKN